MTVMNKRLIYFLHHFSVVNVPAQNVIIWEAQDKFDVNIKLAF